MKICCLQQYLRSTATVSSIVFGNLLDNAIEAAEKLEGEKYISIKIGSYHKMIAASIENNCGEVKWKNGFPVSAKGKGDGIGLLNVQSSVKKSYLVQKR